MSLHERYTPEKKIKPLGRLIKVLILACLTAGLIKLFLFESYTVSGSEMLPGLARNERILINRFATGFRIPLFNNLKILSTYTPETGDLVLIKHPWHQWSGIAEFFDSLTVSLLGLTGSGEQVLVRVIAREGQTVRIDGLGQVYVDGKALIREALSERLSLESRLFQGGRILRQQLLGGEVLQEELIEGARLPKLSLETWREGGWLIAESSLSQPQDLRVFPQPVIDEVELLTWAKRWLALTVLGDEKAEIGLLKSGQTGPEPWLASDETGNLWYRVDATRQGQLIRVENGLASLVVPQGMLFVLNDLRNATSDSRVWGPVYEKTVSGIPFLRFWPGSRLGGLD